MPSRCGSVTTRPGHTGLLRGNAPTLWAVSAVHEGRSCHAAELARRTLEGDGPLCRLTRSKFP
jgi:hypothetical protein